MALVLPPGLPPADPGSLGTVASIDVASSLQDATVVNNAHGSEGWFAHASKAMALVPELATGGITVRAIDVLHRLGVATTPPGLLTPFGSAYHWAQFRYYFAFDLTPPPAPRYLRLSAQANELRYHHRSTLSEHMGIAFGIEVVTAVLRQRHPHATIQAVDAEQALAGGVVPPGIAIGPANAAINLRPDYIFVVDDGGIVTLYLLECKGTSSRSMAPRVKQLAKAARQLNSVASNGTTPTGFAATSVVDVHGVHVIVLDPDGDAEWSGEADYDRGFSSVVERNEGGWSISNLPRFRAELEELEASTLLTWAGAPTVGLGLLPPRIADSREHATTSIVDLPTTTVEEAGTIWEGVEASFAIPGGSLTIFRGLDRDYRRSLLGRPVSNDALTESREAKRSLGRPQQLLDRWISEDVENEVVSFGDAGTMLRVVTQPD